MWGSVVEAFSGCSAVYPDHVREVLLADFGSDGGVWRTLVSNLLANFGDICMI